LREELKSRRLKKSARSRGPMTILFSGGPAEETRSGKIHGRLIKDIAEGRALGDTTTLADPAVVARSYGISTNRRRPERQQGDDPRIAVMITALADTQRQIA